GIFVLVSGDAYFLKMDKTISVVSQAGTLWISMADCAVVSVTISFVSILARKNWTVTCVKENDGGVSGVSNPSSKRRWYTPFTNARCSSLYVMGGKVSTGSKYSGTLTRVKYSSSSVTKSQM